MSSTGDRVSRTFENCFSCKMVSGGGLIAAGAYVYFGARKNVRGGMASVGTMAQIMFALGLASYGITILARTQNSQPQK
ncbi:distal membrane-arm assembly complex protein 1 [Hyla sarda]|uniref:distal membrane-arm assembly complex protein 1 n=1 Tax=Hyla sarda TaxID=327740 RepID=UPI0024C23AAF|nr:distal membrane-arm assembly complex protein 1 [Hyla sarda]